MPDLLSNVESGPKFLVPSPAREVGLRSHLSIAAAIMMVIAPAVVSAGMFQSCLSQWEQGQSVEPGNANLASQGPTYVSPRLAE
jgi:hypothetical protein